METKYIFMNIKQSKAEINNFQPGGVKILVVVNGRAGGWGAIKQRYTLRKSKSFYY